MMRRLGHSGLCDNHDTTFSNLSTIPIIKNLNENIDMMQSTMTSVWIDLQTVPGNFAEISRLQDHIDITRVSLRSNRRENAQLVLSLGEVEESFASIDFDEIHDPLALRPEHSFALKKSIKKLEDMEIESGGTLCYLETLLQDFKDSRTPLRIREDEGFANWATTEMVSFLVSDRPLPKRLTDVQQVISVLDKRQSDVERVVDSARAFHLQIIDFSRKLHRIDDTFTAYTNADRGDKIAMVNAREDIHEAVMTIGHQSRPE